MLNRCRQSKALNRYAKIFKGHFLKSLSTFKAELLSHCSSTAVHFLSLLLSNVKKQTTFCYLRPNRGGQSYIIIVGPNQAFLQQFKMLHHVADKQNIYGNQSLMKQTNTTLPDKVTQVQKGGTAFYSCHVYTGSQEAGSKGEFNYKDARQMGGKKLEPRTAHESKLILPDD
jgi:hypothetical protein